MAANPLECFAVIQRFAFFRREAGVPGSELQLGALHLRVGGQIAFAAREWVVAGPERHAPFGGDEDEASIGA